MNPNDPPGSQPQGPTRAALPDFRLERYFSRWEFRVRYNLAASDAETLSLKELLALADEHGRDLWESLRLGYLPTSGTPALREAVAATYDVVGPGDVITFAGAEEGIYCAMHALLARGDHAVVVVPGYQSLEEIPRALCDVTGVALREEQGWTLDLDELAAALRPRTRLVAVNFPHNPTGATLDDAAWRRLIALVAERGIHLLSDEVYRGLEGAATPPVPPAADLYDRGLSLGVMSKVYGLPGLRVGWIACRDREALSRMEGVKHYLSICNAGPSEVLATIALGARDRILERNRAIVAANLAVLDGFFAARADRFEWRPPQAGCVAFPRYLGPEGAEAFCDRAVHDASVLLLPGSVYRSSLLPVAYERFRIGIGRRDLPEGLAALGAWLDTRGPAPRGSAAREEASA